MFDIDIQFDAIVTDPPFGRREKARGMSTDMLDASDGDSSSRLAIAHLLALASKSLRARGRLVFWLPVARVSDKGVARRKLDIIERLACRILREGESSSTDIDNFELASNLLHVTPCAELRLTLKSMTEDRLHSQLSRWLCVYEKYY